jgi:hypothetical protein
VRRLKGPEPDALVGAADLGIVRVVRLCADAAVAEARAAVGRWCGARWAARSEEGGGGASDTRGMGNFPGGWAARARQSERQVCRTGWRKSARAKYLVPAAFSRARWRFARALPRGKPAVNLPRASFAAPVRDALGFSL